MAFRDVIGHRRLIDLIARAITRDSLPPSLIFTGPPGVGKRLVAIATAQALNCSDLGAARRVGESSPALDACGSCASCKRIAKGMHPDVFLVEPGESGSIKVDQVREIIDRAAYRPFEGRRRVVIVDEADMLVPAAQNALLKTLEEPPSASMFLLITARPDALLPTVQSRCPRLRFWPLDADEVTTALVRLGRREAAARAMAATADGSVGRAIEAGAGDDVERRAVAARVLAHAAKTDDPKQRLEGAKDLLAGTGATNAGDRANLSSGLRVMASLLRDVELVATRKDPRGVANPDMMPAIEAMRGYRGERGVRAFAAVDQALLALERNAGTKIVADWLMMRL
jgi:DNA polymerase-3 subunit delta'